VNQSSKKGSTSTLQDDNSYLPSAEGSGMYFARRYF
jgi:hypothetical protein